ncbi:MAG: DUF3798 domain-containing protein [Treponema sp.]|nr:DUF3798 domain-containing protein [Treponema sp.]
MDLNCKIAYVSLAAPLREEEFRLGELLAKKYGADKFVHIIVPNDFVSESEKVTKAIGELAADREIKILLFPQAIPGTNAGIDKFKEVRDDAFIIYSFIHEPIADSVKRANLILRTNELEVGPAIVRQAKKQGAKAFVHFSFPRHMSIATLASRRDLIRTTCEEEGLKFIDAEVLDPIKSENMVNAQKLITETVPEMVSKYGKDTAFFCTNCLLQSPLIRAVVESRAIYPQPCCPSPFHGFPEALEIDNPNFDIRHMISEASRILEEKDLSDRLSTWPVSVVMMCANAGVEYAIKWLNGEVPKDKIDRTVLLECIDNYIREVVGEDSHVSLSLFTREGVTYNNYMRVQMSYLDF